MYMYMYVSLRTQEKRDEGWKAEAGQACRSSEVLTDQV